MNVLTPLMVYLPFIVTVAQRYKKDAGLGTVISLMIPYAMCDHRGVDHPVRGLVCARHTAGTGVPGKHLASGDV